MRNKYGMVLVIIYIAALACNIFGVKMEDIINSLYIVANDDEKEEENPIVWVQEWQDIWLPNSLC